VQHGRYACRFVALTVLLTSGLCPSGLAQVLVGTGSTVPVPLYRAVAADYSKRNSTIQLKYLPLGTSEGINQISHGVGDFGAGEVPLTQKQRAEGHLIELPVALIGIVPIYCLPDVTQDLRFSGDLLAEIYLGHIKNWNAPQIARLNPSVSLPNLPITIIYRPQGKGTNYVFTDFLSKRSPSFREQIGVSPSPNWPVGTAAERSSDMVDKVRNTPGAIGYVELQYALTQHVRYGLVSNPAGKFIRASAETIRAACEAVESPQWDRFSASLTDAPGRDAFPISSFTWIYVQKKKAADPSRATALAIFLDWMLMLSGGQHLSAQLGYSELPEQLRVKARAVVNSIR
jgi:phosphate transport system substrate-binding protein